MTRVLVIEDDPDGVEVLNEFLEINEFEVVGTGANGLDAINLYKKRRPDVVLMDYLMPEYDGIYGLTKILEFDKNAKVIILSASANEKQKEEMKKLGAITVLTKPYDLDILVDIINKFSNTYNVEAK